MLLSLLWVGDVTAANGDKMETILSLIRDNYLDKTIGKEIFPCVMGMLRENDPILIVCDFFLRKSTKTLDAICVLCETGFAEDALVLVRTIFELALHLQSISSESSPEKQQHRAECFIYNGDRRRVQQLKKLDDLKKQEKCSFWINGIEASNPVFETIARPQDFVQPKNLEQMATELGGDWECWYHFLYFTLSQLAHPSGLGSHTYLQECNQKDELTRAFSVAWTMHFFLTNSILNLLRLEELRTQLETSFKEAFEVFKRIKPI